MTQKELDARIAAIDREADQQKYLAYKQYAADNAKYKIGDIVSDGRDTIRVESIAYSLFNNRISIFYLGTKLTKKGEPFKHDGKRAVFESAIKNV